MNAYDYLVSKQILWAQRRDIRLGGQFRNASDGALRERGRKLSVHDREDNLFEPLTGEARRAFEDGDGGELHADKPGEGNMYALHSSSARARGCHCGEEFSYPYRSAWVEANLYNAVTMPLGLFPFRQDLTFWRDAVNWAWNPDEFREIADDFRSLLLEEGWTPPAKP